MDGGGRWRRDDGSATGGWQRGRHGCVPMSVLKGPRLHPPHGAWEPGFPDGRPGKPVD